MQTTEKAITARVGKRRNRSTLSLAELIASRMRKLRINAQAVSRRSELSPSYICRLLKGERIVVEDEVAVKLAKGIAVDWTDIFRAARNSRAMRRESSLRPADTFS